MFSHIFIRKSIQKSTAAVFFSTYETMKKSSSLPAHLAPLNHMISASVAEVVRRSVYLDILESIFMILQAACLIRVPTEVVKTRTQTLTYGALGQSSLSAAKLLLTNDGWQGFYRGFGSTIMREVAMNISHP
jgi:solute carrier family 25 S-adenosylmethionine transporter 26